jgi:serine/threonine-protein phosphatase 2A regulatory subunit A
MVRRAAASKLTEFVAVCDKHDLLSDMVAVYKQLSQEDTQDTIRMDTVHATARLAEKLTTEENQKHTVKVITDAVQDRSWRVRLTVAHIFDGLCSAFGQDITASDLLPALVVLLHDSEQEVRKTAIQAIGNCITEQNSAAKPFTSEHIQEFVLPQLEPLSRDASTQVRAALASALGPVARVLHRDMAQQHLLPLISSLMEDEFHEVRLNVVGHAGLMCEVLTWDGFVHSLLKSFLQLFVDTNWRIREVVVQQIPKLAIQCGRDMYESKLERVFLSAFRDGVHSVRLRAIAESKTIVDAFGAEWTVQHLMPKIVNLADLDAYANRVARLLILGKIFQVLSASQIEEHMVPMVVEALRDSVPNVRFTACKVLILFMEAGGNLNCSAFKPILVELKSDSDADVQYYAQSALDLC